MARPALGGGALEMAPVHVERGEAAGVGGGERQHAEPEASGEDRAGGGHDRGDCDLEARGVVRQQLQVRFVADRTTTSRE